MSLYIANDLLLFCIAFGLVLLTSFIMNLQSKKFYTQDPTLRKFGIIDLEMPASPQELANIIKGIFRLPADKTQKTLSALRGQLYIDFIFMPAAYGAIFLLCMKVSWKLSPFGHSFFVILAWLQIVAWLCDIIENIYLLKKIDPNIIAPKPAVHKTLQIIEILKWGISLTGAVCAIFVIIYFWLAGYYAISSLNYLLIILGEIILFVIAGKLIVTKTKS